MRRLLALFAAIAVAACRGRDERVVLDLVEWAPAAETGGAFDLVRFGTPAADLVTKGFLPAPPDASGETRAVSKDRPQVFLRWRRIAPRTAVVDMAPYPGVAGQTAEVLLNGVPVGRIDLGGTRRRHRIDLPAEPQKRRENALRFVFARTSGGGPPTALFYNLAVGPWGEPPLADLADAEAPPPLSIEGTGASRRIVQAGPEALRFALRLPEDAALVFSPDRHAGARAKGVAVAFKLTLEERPGAEREIWSQRLGPQDAGGREVRVALPAPAGTLVRVGLHVTGERFAWGVWSSPKIVGRGRPAPLAPDPLPEAESRKADGLRRSLEGTNVLFVILDAAGARHFGCYGYKRATTPEIDRIAAEGVVFERAYTPAVFTRSSMASVWTSQYPEEHHAGVHFEAELPADRLTLAELLSANGVATAGLIANASAGSGLGLHRGFASFAGVYANPDGRPGAPRAEVLREAVLSWLARPRKERRFFLYAHFREPHFPYDPPPAFTTLFGPDAPLPPDVRRVGGWIPDVNAGRKSVTKEEIAHLERLYDGNLAYVDLEIGKLRKALEASGLWDRTVLIVSADHGEAFWEHGFLGHNKQLYEESARIPLIVRFPKGTGPTAARVRELVDLVDLAPTVADVFGVLGRGGSNRSFRGRSLLAVASGAPGKVATVVRSAHELPTFAVADGEYKYLYNTPDGEQELYDLARDQGETKDVSRADPIRAAYYRQALHRWLLGLRTLRLAAPGGRALTPEERESLRALGYVN